MPTVQPARVSNTAFGEQLRAWRMRRRLSQLALALEAELSTRHLSFMETGRAQPSREMVLRLAERLEVPLRERNRLLAAAGYAPAYAERAMNDPDMSAVREAVAGVLAGHEPYPALAVDRHWNLVQANRIVPLFLQGLPPALLAPPTNVLRLSLHPEGLAPRIRNLPEWRAHLLARLARQIETTGDAQLEALHAELRAYPCAEAGPGVPAALVVPLRLDSPLGELNLISTTTVFGTPMDVTLEELAIEALFPADAATAAALRTLAAATTTLPQAGAPPQAGA